MSSEQIISEIDSLLKTLFPINRSITGNGVRETLEHIKKHIPLNTHEIPTGSKVLDWEIPKEWNVNEAYIVDPNGNKILDFNTNNLHLMGYSIPHTGEYSLKELEPYLYSRPDFPEAIPYVTSYYKERWGFCLSENQKNQLQDGTYKVHIDTDLSPGSLTYADYVLPGKSNKEILISTYTCHPSMANNELSGPLVATFIAKALTDKKDLKYTYRFVFCPETIGAITYISQNLEHLKNHVKAGYVVTCAGDAGDFSYLQTREENTLTDRATLHVLNKSTDHFDLYSFLDRGSDERQYNAPGIDLPVGSLMRTRYGIYKEYHTSLDNLDLVTAPELYKTVQMYLKCLEVIESNEFYKTNFLGEPQLGKRGLYPNLNTVDAGREVDLMMNFLAYCDGKRDLIDIAEKINSTVWELNPIAKKLIANEIISLN